jgi:hypothetical protein
MTDRDRLIELQIEAYKEWSANTNHDISVAEFVTDYLLANGVIVPPCKVGDTVYTIFEGDIEALKVICAKTEENAEFVYRYYDAKNGFLSMPFTNRSIGKTVFLTKEEAEAKLKEIGNDWYFFR